MPLSRWVVPITCHTKANNCINNLPSTLKVKNALAVVLIIPEVFLHSRLVPLSPEESITVALATTAPPPAETKWVVMPEPNDRDIIKALPNIALREPKSHTRVAPLVSQVKVRVTPLQRETPSFEGDITAA